MENSDCYSGTKWAVLYLWGMGTALEEACVQGTQCCPRRWRHGCLSAFPRTMLITCISPCLFVLVLKVTPKSTYTFKIPEIHFPLMSECVQAYYTDLVTLLSKAMALLGPGDSLLLARYFYLRGLIHLMQGQLLSALLDFQNLYKTDIGIFPADLVKRMVESMSASERAQAERTPELRRLITEVFDKHGEAPKADDAVKNFELPKKHMQLNDFVKRVQESGIVKDAGIIHRLFDALTYGKRAPQHPWVPTCSGSAAL